MKKIVIYFLMTLLILPTVLSLELNISKISSNEVLIAGIDKPAKFIFEITNNGETDNIEFYNLVGFDMLPKGPILIGGGQTKQVELKVKPIGEITQRGFYIIEYFIKNQNNTRLERELLLKILDIGDVLRIGSGDVDPESNSIKIYIQNKENFDFEKINAKFSSPFFEFRKEFSLGPNERKEFTVQLNKDDFKKLTSGFYTLNAEVKVENETTDIEGMIKFVEKDLLETTKKNYGIIIHTNVITKTNNGNTMLKSETVIKKNIISRLFTNFEPEPDVVERRVGTIYYTWEREIKPGESLEIKITTNWFYPLLIIFFIVAIVILTKQYTKTNLVLRKRVTFVRAKGGEFALKVSIFLHAKKYIEKINVIDRIPPLVKIYERFPIMPSKINEKTKRIEWQFEKLEEGETRLLTYIIYSKVGVLGKFALPSTTAIYERDGKIEEVISNRAFFVAEQSKEEE